MANQVFRNKPKYGIIDFSCLGDRDPATLLKRCKFKGPRSSKGKVGAGNPDNDSFRGIELFNAIFDRIAAGRYFGEAIVAQLDFLEIASPFWPIGKVGQHQPHIVLTGIEVAGYTRDMLLRQASAGDVQTDDRKTQNNDDADKPARLEPGDVAGGAHSEIIGQYYILAAGTTIQCAPEEQTNGQARGPGCMPG